MSIINKIINPDVFTQEELDLIQLTIDRNQTHVIAAVFPTENMTPEKESLLEKIRKFFDRRMDGYSDEEVRARWKETPIETPEQEAKMQKELSAHKYNWMIAHGYQVGVGESLLNQVPNEPETTKDVLAETEVKPKIEERPKRKYVRKIKKEVEE